MISKPNVTARKIILMNNNYSSVYSSPAHLPCDHSYEVFISCYAVTDVSRRRIRAIPSAYKITSRVQTGPNNSLNLLHVQTLTCA